MSEPEESELTPEQLIEAIKRMKVSDLLLSTVTTLAQIGYAKLEEGTRDLEQAQLAIDVLDLLIPKLEPHIPAEITRDLRTMLTNLQLSYAQASTTPAPPGQ